MSSSDQVRLVSSDWNGTLVHGETAVDVLRYYKAVEGSRDYAQMASLLFAQMRASDPPTFDATSSLQLIAEFTRGVSVLQFVDYVRNRVRCVDGLLPFANRLSEAGIPLVINSTGYTVVFEIVQRLAKGGLHGWIANRLEFGDAGRALTEEEVGDVVRGYFAGRTDLAARVVATGGIDVRVGTEMDKFDRLVEYRDRHFPHIPFSHIAHIDDTLGGRYCLDRVARAGGIGLAFNYDLSLSDLGNSANVHFVEKKNPRADARNLLPYLGLR